MDSDEYLDFDCGDEGMENDPRCLNGNRHPCYPFPNVKECRDLNKPLPICGSPEAVGAGLCRDEIDDCTDESGCTPITPTPKPEIFPDDTVEYPTPEVNEEIPDVPEEDNNDNGNVDNGNDDDNDNGSVDNGDSGDSDNQDSGSGEFFD